MKAKMYSKESEFFVAFMVKKGFVIVNVFKNTPHKYFKVRILCLSRRNEQHKRIAPRKISGEPIPFVLF